MTAIAIDEVVITPGGQGFVSSITIPKVGATAPSALTVIFRSNAAGSDSPPNSLTYDGVPISFSTFDLQAGTISGYYGSLIVPNSGAKNFVFSYTGAPFRNVTMLAVFWSGDVTGVSWNTSALAFSDPTISIAKAASSALMAFVHDAFSDPQLVFNGDGTERAFGSYQTRGATQEPAQGAGVIDWRGFEAGAGYYHSKTSYICAEILGAAAVTSGGHPQMIFGM